MISVTCAIIRNEDDEILVVQRGKNTDHPLKWEFPGGKIKKGETDEECIIREIKEELDIDIVICKRLKDTEFDYGQKQIRLIPFICDTLDELPFLSEHAAYKWIDRSELKNIDFAEADIQVAENYLSCYYQDEVCGEMAACDPGKSYSEEDLRTMVGNMIGIREAEWIADSAIANGEILEKLLVYSFDDDKKLAFKASWALSKVYDKIPEYVLPYLNRLTESLENVDNESVQRSFLRILSLSDLNSVSVRNHGILANHCFSMLKSGFSAIAIKAYSMEIIYKLTQIYPELANELSATVNLLDVDLPAGVKSRARIILKKLAAKVGNHDRVNLCSLKIISFNICKVLIYYEGY
jgi:8-oxo-dGTP diphosphatase